MELHKGNHSVYSLQYHLVLVVKYRKRCITKEIGEFLVSESARLLESWNGGLIEGNFESDHLHLLISMDPKYELARYVGVLKKTLSRNVRQKYGDYLAQYLWGGSFWSDSYYIATTGGANLETIQQYIQSQGKPKRKYVRKQKAAGDSSPL